MLVYASIFHLEDESMYLKKIKNPELFQGNKKKDHYFEGWYFKAVSSNELYSVACIPGISVNKKDPHAFIQVFISKEEHDDFSLKTHYYRFDSNEFKYSNEPFSIEIGENHFSKEILSLNLKDETMNVTGTLELRNIYSIKTSFLSPNIMGPFAYLGFMECYHGVISMSHEVHGSLIVNEETILFEKAKGYIEKDWGKSFPKQYIWIQSNHFKDSKTSFMFSYATIPFGILSFKGLIANLLYNGKEIRFATYNFSKIKLTDLKENEVKFRLKKGKYLLLAHAKSEKQIDLKSPNKGMMIDQIKEGLSGWIQIELYIKKKLVYKDIGYHAGIEIMM